MTPDVFISYSRENQQEVIKMVEYLRSQGVAVWMDESDIHGATMWTKEIVEAIRASSVFILAISRHSTGSKNVVKELALASEREKIILPIYLEQCDIPETMEYQLAGIQNIRALHARQGQGVRVRPPDDSSPRRWPSAVGRPSAWPSGGHAERRTWHRRWPRAHGPTQGQGRRRQMDRHCRRRGRSGHGRLFPESRAAMKPSHPGFRTGGDCPPAPASDGSIRIAVLPFENLSTDDNQTKWADLISQEIIGSLGPDERGHADRLVIGEQISRRTKGHRPNHP